MSADSLSLRLHAAVVEHLLRAPESVIEQAKSTLRRIRDEDLAPRSETYLAEWDRILDAGPEAITDVLLDPSDHAATLRSCTPFTGVLSQEEVEQIRSRWRRERDSCS